MNDVQINKIKKRADEYATSYFPYEKQFLEREAVVKCCVHVVTETIAGLEKENAELKEKLKPEKCIEYLAKGGYVKFLCENGNEHDQLTKAKELIKIFLGLMQTFGYSPSMDKFITEAEQFLKECK